MKKRYLFLGLFFAFVLAGWVFMNYYFNAFLLNRLKTELEKTFGTYYTLTFEDIVAQTNGKNFTLGIYGANLSSDTANQEMRKLFPPLFFTSDKLSVENIDVWSLLINNELIIGKIELKNPSLKTFARENKEKKGLTTHKESKSKLSLRKGPISLVIINKIILDKGSIEVSNDKKPNNIIYSGNEIGVEIINVKLNVADGISTTDKDLFENIKFQMSGIFINPMKGRHTLKAGKIEINAKEDLYKLTSVELVPHNDLMKLSKEATYQKTFVNLKLGSLTLFGFDFRSLQEGILKIRRINLNKANVVLFRNTQKKLDSSIIKKSIQEALQSTGLTLNIDTISISKSRLSIDILFNKQHLPAEITLSNISGTILHLKTHSQVKEIMQISIYATIMKSASINFKMAVPLNKKTHSYHAVIKHLDLREWNDIIEKVAPINIKSGIGNKIEMKGIADNSSASGRLVFSYENLVCDVYKKTNDSHKKRSWMYSFATNNAIHHSNPIDKNEAPREVDFYYKKQPFQGQVMLWVGGLIDGMIKTMLKDVVIDQMNKQKIKREYKLKKAEEKREKKKQKKLNKSLS
jgi:hypothetical protein